MFHPTCGTNDTVCVPVENIEAVTSGIPPSGICLNFRKPDRTRHLFGLDGLLFRGRTPKGKWLFEVGFYFPSSPEKSVDAKNSTEFAR